MDKLIHLNFNRFQTPSGTVLRKITLDDKEYWINPLNPVKLFTNAEEAEQYVPESAVF